MFSILHALCSLLLLEESRSPPRRCVWVIDGVCVCVCVFVSKAKAQGIAKKKKAAKANTKAKKQKKPARWLKMRPNGCSKCRETPGCTPSCWKGRGGPP